MFAIDWHSETGSGSVMVDSSELAERIAEHRRSAGHNASVTHRPSPVEQRLNAMIERLDGIRVGEGQDTVDLGDLRQ